MKKLNKKGFTLIELLAVVVILAILVTVSVPAVVKYLGTARRETYATNALRAIDAAKTDYVNKGYTGVKYYTLDKADHDATERNCDSRIYLNDLLEKKLNNSPYGEKLVVGSTGSYIKAESTYDATTRQTTTTFSICLVDTAGNAVAAATTNASDGKITALNLIDEATLSADNTYANVHVSSGITVCPTIPDEITCN